MGRAWSVASCKPQNPEIPHLPSLVQEQGIISKKSISFGIQGAISNLAPIVSQIGKLTANAWPFILFSRSENRRLSLSLLAENPKDLSEAIPSLIDETLIDETENSPEKFFSDLLLKVLTDFAPRLTVIEFPTKIFGTDYYWACLCKDLSRDTLIHFMDNLALRIGEQRQFLERCWQLIGTEISSRVRHTFKNRIGSAYDEIETLKRIAIEKGWITVLTESPDVIRSQQELYHDPDDYYQVGTHLTRIRDNLKALERAVDQLSKFYRGIRGTPELVSVNAALEKQLTIWRAARPDVEIRKDLDSVDPVCLISAEALNEILDNIFGNSKKFVPTEVGHHIFVTSKLCREKVVITIANDGLSSLPDEPTKLFVSTDPQGVGVGLHLVERWVSEVGGAFTITTRSDGPGVENKIELPNPIWKTEF